MVFNISFDIFTFCACKQCPLASQAAFSDTRSQVNPVDHDMTDQHVKFGDDLLNHPVVIYYVKYAIKN